MPEVPEAPSSGGRKARIVGQSRLGSCPGVHVRGKASPARTAIKGSAFKFMSLDQWEPSASKEYEINSGNVKCIGGTCRGRAEGLSKRSLISSHDGVIYDFSMVNKNGDKIINPTANEVSERIQNRKTNNIPAAARRSGPRQRVIDAPRLHPTTNQLRVVHLAIGLVCRGVIGVEERSGACAPHRTHEQER